MTYTAIKSLEELDNILTDEPQDFFIALNGGARSSKSIFKDEDGSYNILNEIDDSEQSLTKEQLFDTGLTNIGDAIIKNSFYKYS